MDDLIEFILTILLIFLLIGFIVTAFGNDYNDKFVKFNMDCIEKEGQIISLDNSWVCQK